MKLYSYLLKYQLIISNIYYDINKQCYSYLFAIFLIFIASNQNEWKGVHY